MASPIQLEICADSIEGALAAAEGGADRVELCTNLSEGGTTPSAASIELTRQRLRIGLHVLIRPRGGDFCYSDLEFEAMKRDIAFARAAGADGIVAGVLRTDGRVDTDRTAALIAVSRPLSFTFHRAFDLTAGPHHALRELLALGVDRLLTSGQSASAPEGADLLTELVDLAGNRLVVMPGGGVNEQTIGLLRMKTGAREFHSSARSVRESPMTYRNPRVAMGANSQEYAWSVVDAGRVRAIRRAAEA